MQVDIKTKNIELTDAIRSAVEKKMKSLEKKVERFGESVTAEVEVGKTTHHHHKGEVFRAEVHVRLPGKLVYAEETNEDLYAAVNEATREAERQIIDYKEKLQDSRRGK